MSLRNGCPARATWPMPSTGGLRSWSSLPRDRTAGPQHHVRCPRPGSWCHRGQVPERPMKSNRAGAAAGCTGGRKIPQNLLSTHQCCLSTAITAASGAFTPSHLGLLFLNNLICLMTREALGPPCCLDLFLWSLKGFSPWWGAATPRTGGLWGNLHQDRV